MLHDIKEFSKSREEPLLLGSSSILINKEMYSVINENNAYNSSKDCESVDVPIPRRINTVGPTN